jgi:hypothetical protein
MWDLWWINGIVAVCHRARPMFVTIPLMLHTRLPSWAGTVGPYEAAVPRILSLFSHFELFYEAFSV